MPEAVIRIENLGKQYRIGQRERYLALRDVLTSLPGRMLRRRPGAATSTENGILWALKDVCLEIQRGEAVGLIGRNGAGKTTLLKILAQITKPTTGYAEVRGRMGSLLEVGTGFHPELTGRENAYLSGAILGMRKKEIDRKFGEMVAFSGVEKFIDTPLKRYSTGMQMRLAFAVAAHLEPEILLVDEVLAVGDLEFQKKCLGKMQEVTHGGRTVIFVSHQMNQIRRLCEKAVWMDSGRIKQMGPTAEVTAAYEVAMSVAPVPREARFTGSAVTAKFLSWEVAGSQSVQRNILNSLGPATIRFAIEVHRPIRMGRHGVALYDSEGRLLWAWAAENLQLDPGIHRCGLTFPGIPLRPGAYSWEVSLWDEHGMVDRWNCLPEMIIATENHQHPEDQWNGILNIPCTYAVESAERKDSEFAAHRI